MTDVKRKMFNETKYLWPFHEAARDQDRTDQESRNMESPTARNQLQGAGIVE